MNSTICQKVSSITETELILETKQGKIRIPFAECAKNCAMERGKAVSKCVANRDITTLSFVFYTIPKTKVIFRASVAEKIFGNKSAIRKFLDLQKAIIEAGYTSYDLS